MKRAAGLVAGLLLAWGLVAFLRTGGIDRGFDADPRYAWVRDLPGVTCEPRRIPARLGPDATRVYTVVGQLCRADGRTPQTLQVLLSGAGYGAVYWDFPYQPDTYSYARSALRAGDAVFNFDRLGMGLSDHPPGLALDVDTQAYVLHQILRSLAVEPGIAAVVTLGHSFGSTIALAHALRWPDEVDGVVLTGFIHNVNPAFGPTMGRGIRVAALSGPVAGELFDPTYAISTPGSRGSVFYVGGNVDPGVVSTDDATRETTAGGELFSMSRYFGDQSMTLQRPALVLIGESDFVLCGDGLDCTDHAAVAAHEARFYPAAACLEVRVLDDTGHNVNLHLNAPASFALMRDWIRRRVGSAGLPATQPCSHPQSLPAH